MQSDKKNTGLVWFRNDLRVRDNAVLNLATQNHEQIIAVYFFDPRLFEVSNYGFKKTEKFRTKFLIETVINLKTNLLKLNIELFVFFKKPETEFNSFISNFNIKNVYLQKEWTKEEKQILNSVKASVKQTIQFYEIFDQFLYHPDDINIPFKSIPKVFTNFRKTVEKNCKVRPIVQNTSAAKKTDIANNTTIPTLETLGFEYFETNSNSAFPFEGGETTALQRLIYYVFETKKLGFYKKTRNGLVGTDYSSKLSPWLANGSISARTIYWAVKQFEKEHFKNQSTYWLIFELIWRDYFKYISLKHGNSIFKIGGILEKDYEWNTDEYLVENWINGKTSSAFVNANMVELQKTGWMSNRGRQNVASFFSRDLLLDWRIGAAYFESLLVDYDAHSNYGNWMYVAGVGNDPRDRKFDTALQSKRYDSLGTFQKLWLQTTLF
ncbi:DASH family cryptochrome [Flavobacteriaceae bacterium GSB9]|nr:DASH family cryptochrome [Flavobacteriaceae bacterium GSB9]